MPKWTDKVQADDFRRNTERALTAVGIHLEGIASLRAPRQTGRLSGSITYATHNYRSPTRSPYNRSRDAVSKPGNWWTLHVGTNVKYAEYMEYGTRRSAAQPYLGPTLRENRAVAREIYKKHLKDMVRGK